MRSLFKNKLFMILTLSDLISNLGDTLFYLALMNYVLTIPQTELAVAAISLSETIPMMTGIFTGDLADQAKHKDKMIVMTQLLRVVIYLIIGAILSFTPTLWIVIVIAVFNLCADLLGQYENSLFIPISLKVVTNEQREDAMAFKQILLQASQVAFMSAGGMLIVFLSYQQIAFINAATFFIAVLIFLSIIQPIKQLLSEDMIGQQTENLADQSTLWTRLKNMYRTLKTYKILWYSTIIFTFVNGAFSSMNTFLLLTIKESQVFRIYSAEITIAALPITMIVGSILGASLGRQLFKKWHMMQLITLTMGVALMIYIGFLIQNVVVVLVCLFIAATLAGVVSPKFNALVMNTLPQENMALVIGGLNTFLTFGIVVISGGVSILINLVPLHFILIFMSIFCLLVLLFCIKNIHNKSIGESL